MRQNGRIFVAVEPRDATEGARRKERERGRYSKIVSRRIKTMRKKRRKRMRRIKSSQ